VFITQLQSLAMTIIKIPPTHLPLQPLSFLLLPHLNCRKARKWEHNGSTDYSNSLPPSQYQPLAGKSKRIVYTTENGCRHKFKMFDADSNVRTMAKDLRDLAFLTRTKSHSSRRCEVSWCLSS